MVWGGKGKAKGGGFAKGGGKAARPKREEPAEVELEGEDEDDDENDVAIGGDDDEEWLAFQSAVLKVLVSNGTLSTGKLGHELGAKKKPVAAALFSLAESGMVERTDGIPPKWTAKPGIDLSELVDAPVAERFLYDESKKRPNAGPKASRDSFEVMKNLVRTHLGQGSNGVTAGALGFKLKATKKVVNAALYACEKDGTAWTVSDPQSGTRLRWAGVATKCNESLPACFSYGSSGSVHEALQPPLKKQRTAQAHAASSSGDAFEDMKLVCWSHVAAQGESGVSSGKLGFELAADRKAVTAALYACMNEGKVQNVSEDGPPRWVCLEQPPESASSVDIPDKFAYKGDKKVGIAAAAVSAPVKKFGILASAPKLANMSGLTPKQQAALAKKGQGKGGQAVAVAAPSGGGSNPIAFINEWAQKSKKALSFQDAGQDASGEFICQCVVDGEEVAVASARNKKQAKADAAAAALQALGMA